MKKNEIIIASKNKDKIKEIKAILDMPGLSFLEKEEQPEIIEDGATFLENALKKAKEISRYYNMFALADDSGLEVEYLNGAPGIYSARYAGKEKDYDANNRKLLEELAGVPLEKRVARFVTVIVLYAPDGRYWYAEGELKGYIIDEKRGENGFGYDPVFMLENDKRTLAELTKEEKNAISHRANALKKLSDILKNRYSEIFG